MLMNSPWVQRIQLGLSLLMLAVTAWVFGFAWNQTSFGWKVFLTIASSVSVAEIIWPTGRIRRRPSKGT